MSIEASPTSKSAPAEVTAQATKSTHEKPLSKLAEGAPESPVTAKGSQLDQDVRHNPTQSTSTGKFPSASFGSETQRGPSHADPVTDPLPNSVSVDQVNKRTLGIATKPKQAPDLKEEKEEGTGTGNPEEVLRNETALADEITELWSSQKRKSLSLRRSRHELETMRISLSNRLYEYKHLLARTGRGGKWTEFLREQNIPRTTADRYVEKWKRSTSPNLEKRTDGAINGPTKEEIAQMVKKLTPKLVLRLTTPDSVNLFMAELGSALQPEVPGV
jgi:hypothetical protein